MKKIRFILFFVMSLPKTLFYNFILFGFLGLFKLPIIFGYNVKTSGIRRGSILIECKFEFAMIRFGFGGPEGVVAYKRSYLIFGSQGRALFKGKARFGAGSSLRCDARLEIGDNFSSSKNTFISCGADGSVIGNNVMCGWNVSLRDSDGHTVYFDGVPKTSRLPFIIGNHVWICAEAHILKGVKIGDDSIVAYRSTVIKSFEQAHSLIGGTPAKLIRLGVDWGKEQANEIT